MKHKLNKAREGARNAYVQSLVIQHIGKTVKVWLRDKNRLWLESPHDKGDPAKKHHGLVGSTNFGSSPETSD